MFYMCGILLLLKTRCVLFIAGSTGSCRSNGFQWSQRSRGIYDFLVRYLVIARVFTRDVYLGFVLTLLK